MGSADDNAFFASLAKEGLDEIGQQDDNKDRDFCIKGGIQPDVYDAAVADGTQAYVHQEAVEHIETQQAIHRYCMDGECATVPPRLME